MAAFGRPPETKSHAIVRRVRMGPGTICRYWIKHQNLRRPREEKLAAIERLLDPVVQDLHDIMANWVP
jgi:hypothetical protein